MQRRIVVEHNIDGAHPDSVAVLEANLAAGWYVVQMVIVPENRRRYQQEIYILEKEFSNES